MKNKPLRFSRHWALAAAIAAAMAVAPAAAAAATWLDLGTTGSISELPNKPLDSKKPSWIEISSYSFGAGKPAVIPRGGGRMANAPSTDSMSIVITSNPSAAQMLFEDAKAGTALRFVRLYMMKPSSSGKLIPYYVVTMTNVIISSARWSGGASDAPTEEVTFEYGGMEIRYNDGDKTAPDPKSPISWNIVQNRPNI